MNGADATLLDAGGQVRKQHEAPEKRGVKTMAGLGKLFRTRR